jgi:prepilin-type N-terminal cleavage/methylation domain-containing protein
MNRPRTNRRSLARSRGGFTLIELLMVIIIIAILVGLLLPAVNSALKTARKAAVSSEISQLAQALANFKSRYGDYPPSRFLAVESGNYSTFLQSTQPLSTSGTLPDPTQADPTSSGDGDITVAQLAQRSVSALRKFWPRVTTTVQLGTGNFYDFNGNNVMDGAYVLHGHECLVFFLGGVPTNDGAGHFGLSGFDKNPLNPFTNILISTNRQPPLFEFNPGRLFLDPNTQTSATVPGIPGYYDSLNNAVPAPGGTTLNFYAYFSAYGNSGYDPNDVNVSEMDANSNGPIGLSFQTSFGTFKALNFCSSFAPNPYTSTLSVPLTVGAPVTFLNPQTFQIISSGIDGLYGVGGQFNSNTNTPSVVPLPFDATNTFAGSTMGKSLGADTDLTIRNREGDNLTNFKPTSLQ